MVRTLKPWWMGATLAALMAAGCGKPSHVPSATAAPEQETSPASAARLDTPEPVSPPVIDDERRPLGPPLAIPLTFSSAPTSPYAISSGIPFPRGALTSLKHLWLEDGAGHPVPAQFTPLARWPDQSYKAVLVSMIANMTGTPASFMLRSAAEVPTTPAPSRMSVQETDSAIMVTTGPMRFQVSKQHFGVFDQLWVDADRNGTFDESEQLLRAPGEIFLVNAADGREYHASRDPHPHVTIEENGPLRVVLAARGTLQADAGARLTDFIMRFTAFAGLDTIRLDYTLVDPREEANVDARRSGLALNVTSYGIRLPLRLTRPANGLFGGETAKHTLAYGGPLLEQQSLYQGGQLNYINGEPKPFTLFYDGVGRGERADGWVDASDTRLGLAAMVRHFWQQFPKELAIDHDTLVIYLHPPEPASVKRDRLLQESSDPTRYTRPTTFYFPREGGAKTYQLLFQAHRGAGEARALAELYATFQDAPRLMPSLPWLCQSDVFGHLIEAGPWSRGYDANLLDGYYVPSVERHRVSGGLAVMFGWRDFGDRMRPGWAGTVGKKKIPGFYNDTHIGAKNFFDQYVHTGDERWFELGEISSRHWMDIDVSHANRKGHWKHGYGPGEAHVIKHEMVDHDDPHLHWGHAHLSGLPDYYLLTGDQRALEVIREVGDWWTRAALDFFPVPTPQPHYAEAERDYAWPLFVLNEAYRATGDPKYLKASAHIVQHLIGWWQQPSDHWVKGQRVGRNDWQRGTGWWAMNPAQDNSPRGPKGIILYNGTNPWMAGALLSALIQFRELDRDFHLVDDALVEEMLLQTMNYVVKYGYDGRSFIYSEAARDTKEGMNQLVYPLAYTWRLLQAGGHPHPEWYDTSSQWIEIAAHAYYDWHDVRYRGINGAGFYGYEMIYPLDFFALMHELEREHPDLERLGR